MYNTSYEKLQKVIKLPTHVYKPLNDFSEDNLTIHMLEFNQNLFTTQFEKLVKLQTDISNFRSKFAQILLKNKINEEDLIINLDEDKSTPQTREEMSKEIADHGIEKFLKKKFSSEGVHNIMDEASQNLVVNQAALHGKYSSQILVVYLGVSSHWVGLVCHRFGKKVEFLLLDSKNYNFLFMSQKDINQYIESQMILSEWSEKSCRANKQMIYDYQSLMNLIMDSFSGEIHLLDHMLYEEVYKMLPMFKKHPLTKRYQRLLLRYQQKKAFFFETDNISIKTENTGSQKDSNRFIQSEFGVKNKRIVLQFHIKDNADFKGFSRNKNPAEVVYPEASSLEDEAEILKYLGILNRRIKVYKDFAESLSFKGRIDLHKAERDVDVFNKVFGYNG